MSDNKFLMTPREARTLQRLAKAAPDRGKIVELGTFRGYSTSHLCEGAGYARVISIDNYSMKHHGEASLEDTAAQLARDGYWPMLIQADSRTPVVVPVAMLFIDSHHHPQTLSEELKVYESQVLPYGIIALHDYGRREEYPGYTEFIDEYLVPKYRCLQQADTLIAFQVRLTDV